MDSSHMTWEKAREDVRDKVKSEVVRMACTRLRADRLTNQKKTQPIKFPTRPVSLAPKRPNIMTGLGQMKKVVVAGGSGCIGREVCKAFNESGYDVVVLSRSGKSVAGARAVRWDAQSLGAWQSEIDGAEAVVNLCGESLMQRWTDKSVRLMHDSRIGTTKLIGEAIMAAGAQPQAWVNGSAVGWYGDSGHREVSEGMPAAEGMVGKLCKDWEAAVDAVHAPNVSKTKLRIGLVLGNGCAYFDRMKLLTKLLHGGPMGSGKQYVSWIHVGDLSRMVVWAIENQISGVLNATAPNPVNNAEIMAEFRRALGMPFGIPSPEFAIKAMCGLMGWNPSFVLGGTRAVPAIALGNGFVFDYPEIRQALESLIDETPKAWKDSPLATP